MSHSRQRTEYLLVALEGDNWTRTFEGVSPMQADRSKHFHHNHGARICSRDVASQVCLAWNLGRAILRSLPYMLPISLLVDS